jgi:cell division protein FtsQ
MDGGGRDMPPLNASPSGAAASRKSPRQPKRRGLNLGRWLKRGAKTVLLLAIAGGVAFAWRSGRLAVAFDRIESRAVALSSVAGFRVEDVEVTGRAQTDPKALLAAVGLKRGDPILAFSPAEARQRIESLPWVASATIERRLPDTIAITIVERRPIALWQHSERLSLIDAEGANLGPVALESAPTLPLVVGGDAPIHAAALLTLLAQHPDIAHRVQASSWIGSRRWDLKLDNGVDVLLPEQGVAEALQALADAETSSRLIERDVAAIDLRLPGKMVVRLTHEPTTAKSKPQQGI